MKKSKVLSKPTRISDIRFDDMYDDDFETQLKYDKLNARKHHSFRRESKAFA